MVEYDLEKCELCGLDADTQIKTKPSKKYPHIPNTMWICKDCLCSTLVSNGTLPIDEVNEFLGLCTS